MNTDNEESIFAGGVGDASYKLVFIRVYLWFPFFLSSEPGHAPLRRWPGVIVVTSPS
jgi:hypothetical protein